MLYQLIKSELPVIICYCLNTFIILLIFSLTTSPVQAVYPLVLSICILCLYLGIKYLKFKRVSAETNNFKIANYQVSYNSNDYDLLYLNAIEDIHADYKRELEAMYRRISRNEQLLSQFVHNMKTSVAVIELASSREHVRIEDIRLENEKLKSQLEQSLNVLRLDRAASDYLPQKYSLKDLVVEVINNNKSNFIYNQIYPKLICNEDLIVFTDRKWFKYLLEQLVSNAIKYSEPGGNVTFTITDNMLVVEDEGIGIESSEQSRIFDLFYTGSNGRDNRNSTGIGLNMVKTVSEMLDIEVTVESEVGVGSKFKLQFLTKM